MNKRIAFALAAVLLVIGYLVQSESDPAPGDEAPAAQETEPAEPTMAEVWARSANASLDIQMEQFFSQMPDDLASAQWTEQRVHTMTWADGSVVVTNWKPNPTPELDGLILDFIEKIGR